VTAHDQVTEGASLLTFVASLGILDIFCELLNKRFGGLLRSGLNRGAVCSTTISLEGPLEAADLQLQALRRACRAAAGAGLPWVAAQALLSDKELSVDKSV
jgi:hypothetical protein